MSIQRSLIFTLIGSLMVLTVMGCQPIPLKDSSTPLEASKPQMTQDLAQNSGIGITIDPTPLSEADLSHEPSGQSEPGGSSLIPAFPTEASTSYPPSTSILIYTDTHYQFTVNYPADFKIQSQIKEQLMQFYPTPVASIRFLNPISAASDVVELEPADFEVRIFDIEDQSSLEEWLTSKAILSADSNILPVSFQTVHVSGLQVCPSTMLAPGCSYFILGNSIIYQLVSATLEGESILQSFALKP